MAKKKQPETQKKADFIDPLAGIDPVMEDAFSVSSTDSAPAPSQPTEPTGTHSVSDIQFPELKPTPTQSPTSVETDLFRNIPVNVSVELGRARISLKEIYELSEGSIIELERLVGEPLDLVINNQVIAKGEVVAIDNNYGLRITDIVSKIS